MTINMIDCQGHGNKTESSKWIDEIVEYLTNRLKEYRTKVKLIEIEHRSNDQTLSRELKKVEDTRVHCILYFFEGHRCKQLDY